MSQATGRFTSDWAVLTRDEEKHRRLVAEDGWSDVPTPDSRPAWTDDFVNIFEAIR